ncbi:MAG: hypothetical protein LRZ84_14345 [Desertifilum sp.]|nr:hypothetical protein [Desertifilum sp.]
MARHKPNGKIARLYVRSDTVDFLVALADSFGYTYANAGSPSKMLEALASGDLVALKARSLAVKLKPRSLDGGDKIQYKPTLYRESFERLTDLAYSLGYHYADRGSISAFLEGVASNEVLLFRREFVIPVREICKQILQT